MKTIRILKFTTCFMITAFSLIACGQNKAAKKDIAKADEKSFAVLELFTSEGCSSCPPADELLARIQKEAQANVYLLAYHVDYWDRQGWKDVFSNADYSDRQIQYGNWLHIQQIYTPQLIVNGKAEFVGSEESAIRNAVSEQLSTKATATLKLQTHQDQARLQVHYEAKGALKGNSLLIALVEKNAHSDVKAGENAGRALSHVQIVRNLRSEILNATGNGTVMVALPEDFNHQNWEVLALIQDQRNGKILGAAKADLNDGANAK